MAWMHESFKKDKRFLGLQLKRGRLKRKDIEAILSELPDVSTKAEPVRLDSDSARTQEEKVPEESTETEG